MSNIVLIDSRVMGFGVDARRIVGACDIDTGMVKIMKEMPFVERAKKTSEDYRTIVVTDAVDVVQDWDLAFNAKEHLDDVVSIYQMRQNAKLIDIDDNLQRYNPSQVLQVKKLDTSGLEQEFNSGSVDNGHMAVLLLVWASHKAKMNSDCLTPKPDNDFDPTLIPFSV